MTEITSFTLSVSEVFKAKELENFMYISFPPPPPKSILDS